MTRSGAMQLPDPAPGVESAYDTTPEQQHAARMYVCTRLEVGDARLVLETLGLIEPVGGLEPAARDTLGRVIRERNR